jgi:hypothetical protein
MKAILVDDKVVVYEGAYTQASVVKRLAVGDDVVLGENIDQAGQSWTAVSLPTGQRGFVLRNTRVRPAITVRRVSAAITAAAFIQWIVGITAAFLLGGDHGPIVFVCAVACSLLAVIVLGGWWTTDAAGAPTNDVVRAARWVFAALFVLSLLSAAGLMLYNGTQAPWDYSVPGGHDQRPPMRSKNY